MHNEPRLDFLRSYSIEDLERLIEYRTGGEHYLDVFKAIANEKHGGKLYNVPDGATLTDAEADLARTRLPGLLRWKPGERLARAPYRILYVLTAATAGVLCVLGCIGFLYGLLYDRTNVPIVLIAGACVGIGLLLIVGSRIAWWVEVTARRAWEILDILAQAARRTDVRAGEGA